MGEWLRFKMHYISTMVVLRFIQEQHIQYMVIKSNECSLVNLGKDATQMMLMSQLEMVL
jgi:hypothetical protein